MCFDPLLILMEDRAKAEIAFDPIGTMGEHVELSALRPQLDLHAGLASCHRGIPIFCSHNGSQRSRSSGNATATAVSRLSYWDGSEIGIWTVAG
jgi:hypothetical protein